MATPRARDKVVAEDFRDLPRLGYAPELYRERGGCSNFAISFSIISVLTGAALPALEVLARCAVPHSMI